MELQPALHVGSESILVPACWKKVVLTVLRKPCTALTQNCEMVRLNIKLLPYRKVALAALHCVWSRVDRLQLSAALRVLYTVQMFVFTRPMDVAQFQALCAQLVYVLLCVWMARRAASWKKRPVERVSFRL